MSTLRHRVDIAPYVLSNVTLTGRKIRVGAYSSVEEALVYGTACKATAVLVALQDESTDRADLAMAEEIQLMSTLRHPHIVQFLGVCFPLGSRLPALVTERLWGSLHDLLECSNSAESRVTSYIPLSLKCSIIHDIASGLAYLQHRSPPVVHGDLSARNVLLDSAMVAKIAGLGVARIVHRLTTTNKSSDYTPPEVANAATSDRQELMYGSSVDIFSLGLLAIFTLGQIIPFDMLEQTCMVNTASLRASSELEQSSEYVQRLIAQFGEGHPLITLIQRCLHNSPAQRPTIDEVLVLLDQAKLTCVGERECNMTKLELIQILHSQSENKVYYNA